MALGNLVDELVVQGIRGGVSSSLSKALSGALAGSVSKLASSGALSGLAYGGAGNLADAVKRVQPPSSNGPSPYEVEGLTVTAPVPKPPVLPAGALGNVLAGGAGANAIYGNSGDDTIQSIQPAQQPPTELEGVNVVAPVPPPVANYGQGAGAAGVLAGGLQDLRNVELEPVTVEGLSQPDKIGPEDLLLPAAAAGALLTMGGGGNITPAAAGGGFDPKTLLPLAPLLPLIPGLTGGGGGGANQDALESLAQKNSALADRLGNIASAGFEGNIGGKGLNSINRMVRKAQAAIRQRYASMGMSGSSAEIADLNAAAQSGVDLQFKVGQEMAQTGLNAIAALTGQSANIYASLLNAQTAKNTALGNALANFAGALVD